MSVSPSIPTAGTNLTILVGTLSRDAEVRTLPSGDQLVALELTVHPPDGPAESVPIAWPDPPASAARFIAGEELIVTGRVRRRYFRAGGSTQSRTEVVATRAVPTRRKAAAGKALAAALGRSRGSWDRPARVRHDGAMNQEQLEKVRAGKGFIAALDQSGGSTPKALKLYGVGEDEYSGDDEMFDRIHEMRSRIITSPSFSGDRVLGAILFEQTMDRQIDGRDTSDYLWDVKGVVPFLKIDKGLEDEADGVQLMKPMPGLDALLERAVTKGVFGTKERSVVKLADAKGVQSIADQQFEVGRQVLGHGLVPILEPEVDIKSPQKAEAEALLKAALLAGLDGVPDGQQVMFKLTLPEQDGFYDELVSHPKVAKVVALSGGYSRDEANDRLARNKGVIASFSRALTEGLSAQQSDEEFDAALDASIKAIYEASIT